MTMNDDFLDAALKRQTQAPATDDAAVARVLARLAGPLPRQKRPFWRLPTVLLDWQFAPAWPRSPRSASAPRSASSSALPASTAPIGGFTLSNSTTGAGFGAVLFEPEAVTGAQP